MAITLWFHRLDDDNRSELNGNNRKQIKEKIISILWQIVL